MKGIIQRKYGSPDVLELKDLEKPVPSDNEVLIKVYAASINNADLDYLHGSCVVRPGGLFRPKNKIPGSDIAGKVEFVGKKVSRFKVNDEVMADLTECGFSAFAEYVTAPEKAISLKPAGISFVEAACIPQAASLACQSLMDHRRVSQGDRVLINGAGGGTGTFAIQVARHFGAEVTAVDKSNKLSMMSSIGADHVMDYMKEDFAKSTIQYDLIIDLMASRPVSDIRKVLSPDGSYVMVGGSLKIALQIILWKQVRAKSNKQKLNVLYGQVNKYLDRMSDLIEKGIIKFVIDSTYPLEEISKAFWQFQKGYSSGKIAITICDNK
ncbi:MAG: NAD(P)-dependent alcohol dehydrogenase [Spirochaetota bacterium]|nr:NAD(P)-dependent alcohol dehydrogenase [Spirochaetota bacterium]